MKLYLTEILKEANQAGFANQPDTSFNTLSPQPAMQAPMPSMQPAPMMMPNAQAGGMMLPNMGGQMGQLSLTPPKLTPSI